LAVKLTWRIYEYTPHESQHLTGGEVKRLRSLLHLGQPIETRRQQTRDRVRRFRERQKTKATE
jgi:hypothetical protein